MNKTIYKLIFCMLVAIGSASCSNTQDDLFDDSSANRLNQAAKDYTELLTSSQSGWVMEYFPSETEKGYTFLMQFDKGMGVKIAAKNSETGNVYKEESSLWSVITDNGPVLSFNSYNNLFHIFSDPDDIKGTDDDEKGIGHGGDYEFILLKRDGDNLEIKGKKHQLHLFMHKLKDGQNWEEYFAMLEKVNQSMFSAKVPILILKVNGEKFMISNATKQVFHFVPEGGDPITQTTKVPFIVLEDGIRMVKPFKGKEEKFSVQNFKLTEDGTLQCVEDGVSTITTVTPAEILTTSGFVSRIDKNKLGGKFVTAYENVVTQSKSALKTVFTYFEFRIDSKLEKPVLSFKNGKYTGYLNFTPAIGNEAGSEISYSSDFTGDNNGAIHMNLAPAYKEFMELLTTGKYKVEYDSKICPTMLTVTSLTDSKDYFVANIQ